MTTQKKGSKQHCKFCRGAGRTGDNHTSRNCAWKLARNEEEKEAADEQYAKALQAELRKEVVSEREQRKRRREHEGEGEAKAKTNSEGVSTLASPASRRTAVKEAKNESNMKAWKPRGNSSTGRRLSSHPVDQEEEERDNDENEEEHKQEQEDEDNEEQEEEEDEHEHEVKESTPRKKKKSVTEEKALTPKLVQSMNDLKKTLKEVNVTGDGRCWRYSVLTAYKLMEHVKKNCRSTKKDEQLADKLLTKMKVILNFALAKSRMLLNVCCDA